MKENLIDVIDPSLIPNTFIHAYHGIAVVGLKGEFLLVNNSLCNIIRYEKGDLLKLTFQDITHKEDLNLDLRELNKLLNGDSESYKMQKRYFRKDGIVIWAQLSVSLVKNEDGTPKYFVSQIEDITSSKKKEAENEIIAKVIKEQNDRLLNFSRIITHNLRTHAGNLSILTDFVEEEVTENQTNDCFITLKKAVLSLQNTVNHLTEIAESDKYDNSELKELNLCQFAENAIYNISALAKNNDCFIENNIDKTLNVKGIEAYLESILLNLLTNAIKYKDDIRHCHIVLSSKLEDGYIVLRIKDNGLGIDLKKYGNKMFLLYQTFHQNKDSKGVGLFISKNQIEAIGGEIKVESEVGIGTEFIIYLKAA